MSAESKIDAEAIDTGWMEIQQPTEVCNLFIPFRIPSKHVRLSFIIQGTAQHRNADGGIL